MDLDRSPTGYWIVEYKMQITILDRSPSASARMTSVKAIADDVWTWMEAHKSETTWAALVPTGFQPVRGFEDDSMKNIISAFIVWCTVRIAVK